VTPGIEKAEQDADFRTGPLEAEGSLAPFAESAGAVVRAALRGGEIEDLGTEKGRDTGMTHYRLATAGAARDALAALPAEQTAWFELERASEVSSIDVWVAGDLIHRITVDQGPRQATVAFLLQSSRPDPDHGAARLLTPGLPYDIVRLTVSVVRRCDHRFSSTRSMSDTVSSRSSGRPPSWKRSSAYGLSCAPVNRKT
jgi:hypothetical protein